MYVRLTPGTTFLGFDPRHSEFNPHCRSWNQMLQLQKIFKSMITTSSRSSWKFQLFPRRLRNGWPRHVPRSSEFLKTFPLALLWIWNIEFISGSGLLAFGDFGVFSQVLWHRTTGQEEKALEDARKKKEKEAERAKQQKEKHQPDEEHESNENHQCSGPTIPTEVNGALTHDCLAIYEALEAADGDFFNMTGSGFEAWFQTMLPVACTTSTSLLQALRKSPIALLHEEPESEGCNITWKAPSWWEECSKKLETSCMGSVPDGETPPSYVGAWGFTLCG